MRHPLMRIFGIILLLLIINLSAYYLSMHGSMLELLLVEAMPIYLLMYLISKPESRLRKIIDRPKSEKKGILQRTFIVVIVGMIFFLMKGQGASVRVDAIPVADHIIGLNIQTKWHTQKYAECIYRAQANQKCISTYGLSGIPSEPKAAKVSFFEWVVTGTIVCKDVINDMAGDWEKSCD